MKVLLTSVTILACICIFSCSKNSTPPNPGSGPNSLFPLTQGDTWYYQDSAFSDSNVLAAYSDTMTVTRQTYQDQTGTIYLGVSNPYGWFAGSYISVDPTNDAIYEVDSPYFSPYIFFAVPQQDGQLVGSGSQASNNPACPFTINQYGYLGPFVINGFSCMSNVEYTTDCNNVPQEEIISFVAQGTGVVRIEHYFPDSTQGGPLHKDYTQTLTSATIKK
jgi:hypothetical protein